MNLHPKHTKISTPACNYSVYMYSKGEKNPCTHPSNPPSPSITPKPAQSNRDNLQIWTFSGAHIIPPFPNLDSTMYHGCPNAVGLTPGKKASNSFTENVAIEVAAFVQDVSPCSWFSFPWQKQTNKQKNNHITATKKLLKNIFRIQ